MGKPKAPTPPDPSETASAQTSTNLATAIANMYLGNVNQKTPYGSLDYERTGVYNWKDPMSGKTYKIPTMTATQTLSPQQKQLLNQNNRTQLNLSKLGTDQSKKLSDLLSKPFQLEGLPDINRANYNNFGGGAKLQTNIGDAGRIQGRFGDAGEITKSYGAEGDYGENVKRVEDALMQRMNPYLADERKALETRMAEQGIQAGSEAYGRSMSDYGKQANDARFGAILSAGQEQNRLDDLSRNRATFENSAQQQQYGQLRDRASFGNEAQQQRFAQLLGRGQFGNAATQQMNDNAYRRTAGNNQLEDQRFNNSLTERNQLMQEQFALRNQPLNEISSLLSGGQVTMPSFMNITGQKMPTVDYAGLEQQNYSNQMQAYQQQMAQSQSLFGGLFGLGSSLLMSDERTKKDIEPVGELDGENIYSYRYKHENDNGPLHIGVMAQEVEKRHPEAVQEIGGIKHVHYGRLFGLGSRAA